jgi:MoaA/NifB/PqqE/SkfB family radical SAM enzyme
MCYQAAGPKGSDLRGDSDLDLDTLKRVVEEGARLPELGNRVHVSGGEGFIDFKKMVAVFSCARDVGFRSVGATTNAFWALTSEIAALRCEQLAAAGVTYLEVSMDHWHLPYVPLERVRNLLRAAKPLGIRVMLRTLSSRAHFIGALFKDFSDADLAGAEIANSRVMPVGRGAATIPPEDVFGDIDMAGNCESVLNLTISPNGNVYPCCAGADMTDSLSSGNVHHDSLQDIVLRMRTDQMIRHLVHNGSPTLIPIIESLGMGHKLKDKYFSICHLCWDIFKDDELSAALRSHFNDVQYQMMAAFVEGAAEAS